MYLTLRSPVKPKIARLSCSYVQSSGYVLLGSGITLVSSHQALQLAQAPDWRRYGIGLAHFSDEERTTANSYYETSTRRHGQRCPPIPPATRAHIFWYRCHTHSRAAANAKAGELRGIDSTHRQKERPLLVTLEVGGAQSNGTGGRVMHEIQEDDCLGQAI
jgi:hypothetical protein